MSTPLFVAVVATLALVATALLTPLVRGAAISMGMVPPVTEDRWHRRPTPAVGGVAIYVGFGVAMGLAFVLDPDVLEALRTRSPASVLGWSPSEGLLVGATVAFGVGLVDDVVTLRPVAKLTGQVMAASVLLLSGIGVWLTGVYVVDAAISVLWFVAVTNAVNLLDNMDGLAAGVAAVAGGYLTLIFLVEGRLSLVPLSLAFTGAVLGFLLHNYPPARIFMGDAGSHFLGLFLAGLALSPGAGLSRSLLAVVAVPALVLAIPLLDTTVVTVGRVLEGRPVSQGGRDHTSHRLVDLGLPEERTIWVLWGLALAGGGAAFLLRTTSRGLAALLGGILVTALVLLGTFMLSIRFRGADRDQVDRVSVYRALIRLNERYPVLPFVVDAGLVALAYYAAYLIRWDPAQLPAELDYFRSSVVVVVAAKLLALTLTGVYEARWFHFDLSDGLRVLRASALGTLATAAALLLIQRTGLSRGVLVIDFLVATVLILASRLSFRAMEGATRSWSTEGTPAVLLASLEDVGLARRALARIRDPDLRPVAVADPEFGGTRGRVGGVHLYGGEAGLANALRDTEAPAVVVMAETGGMNPRRRDDALVTMLDHHLEHRGAVDVYRLQVGVERVERVRDLTREPG